VGSVSRRHCDPTEAYTEELGLCSQSSSNQCTRTKDDTWFPQHLSHPLLNVPLGSLSINASTDLLRRVSRNHSPFWARHTWCFSIVFPYLYCKMEAVQQAFHKWLLQTTTSQLLCRVPAFAEFQDLSIQQYRIDFSRLSGLKYFLCWGQSQSVWCSHRCQPGRFLALNPCTEYSSHGDVLGQAKC